MKRVIAPLLAVAMVSLGVAPAFAVESSSQPEDVSAYFSQRVTWTPCGFMSCTTITAPLDWSAPKGAKISIALNRHSATGTSHGALVVNPGGPGGSGLELAQGIAVGGTFSTLASNFDIVGFDPRGVGASTQVVCSSDPATSSGIFDVSATRGSAKWIAQQRAAQKALGAECLKNTGSLLAHVDTKSVARDLDLIRSVLGESKLNYLGFSYGTSIGATYAELFPNRVGRFVLDGAVDPALSSSRVTLNQAVGFENALRAYVTDCLRQYSCPFSGKTVRESMSWIRSTLDSAESSPFLTSAGESISSDMLVVAIVTPLYSKASWPELSGLFRALGSGNADSAAALMSDYWSGGANSAAVNHAVNCLDYPAPDSRPSTMARERAQLEAAAPTFGTFFAYSALNCSEWPFRSPTPRAPIHAHGANLIVVVGTTNDPATPYSQAVALAGQLDSSRLITLKGEGHTAYGQSACVQNAVDSYLVNGVAPKKGLTC
ncbi:MAG TPA: alpha/beta hydrolase [Microbacteriaceae bacterium]|nr:alpha/beta hydrolase [Microbacteriaceae bacterium]